MNKQEGFIALWRSFKKWEWYDDTNVKIVFLDLLLNANYEVGEWRGITINKGQHITSVSALAERLNISTQNVRTALRKLKSTNEITIETTSQYTIITINNWNTYQDTNKRNNNQLTNEQQTTNKRLTTNNKNNKNNNITNKDILSDLDAQSKMVVDYLNQRTGKAYRYSDSTLKHIRARLRDGFTIDDCRKVIDNKCIDWKGTKYEQYIRPETLFTGKFETYLNEKPHSNSKKLPDYMQENDNLLNDPEWQELMKEYGIQ